MTRELYDGLPAYRDELDRCLEQTQSLSTLDLQTLLLPKPGELRLVEKQLQETEFIQPALFVVEYALARVLIKLGLEPACMLGHSVGEYVAACLAGVFSFETAFEIVVKRGQLVQETPRGSMLAVAMSEKESLGYLNDQVSLASINGSKQIVLSGNPDAVASMAETLKLAGIACKKVKVTRAFHSTLLDPVLQEFAEFVAGKKLQRPVQPFLSCLHGQMANPEEVCSASYWVHQLREPVRFHDAVGHLLANPNRAFVEVGPGVLLTSLVKGYSKQVQARQCLSTCPGPQSRRSELQHFSESMRRLEAGGLRVQYDLLPDVARTAPFIVEEHRRVSENSMDLNESDHGISFNKLEERVNGWFCQVLGIPEIDRDANFLETGGNSLMAMQVISRARKYLNVDIPISDFFVMPTVAGIARLVSTNLETSSEQVDASTPQKSESVPTANVSRQSLPQRRRSARTSESNVAGEAQSMAFGLFFFAGDESADPDDRFGMLLDAARFADEAGFSSIWTPERHFNKFGGLYPNPAVLGAAIASVTRQIHIRGGSVVAPLHHPVRIAEEWSVVDNLSKGRVGVAFGSGFHPKDFLLAPDDFDDRKERMLSAIKSVRELWRGGSYSGRSGSGMETEVELFPKPYSSELPIWLATTRDPATFAEAGKLGAGVLTALLRMSLPELKERIEVYRAALRTAGHDPIKGKVTVMLHTFVGPTLEEVRKVVEAPLKAYLRSHMEHTRMVAVEKAGDQEFTALTAEEEESLLDHAFERYLHGGSLIGTVESCQEMLGKLREIGVDEVGCLVDFGVDRESLMSGLIHLSRLRSCALDSWKNEMAGDGQGETASPQFPSTRALSPELCPLSHGQQRLWFLDRFESGTAAYNLHVAIRLQGNLQVKAMESAIQKVIRRHDSLRARFNEEDGRPIQVIEPTVPFELRVKSLEQESDPDAVSGLLQEETNRPFRLNEVPLFRALLVRESELNHTLLLVVHHIISDGWSIAILKREIAECYRAIVEGKPCSLPALSVRYSDYCRQQGGRASAFGENLKYWKRRLTGAPRCLDLPADQKRPPRQTFSGAEVRSDLSMEACRHLKQIVQQEGVSLFAVLLAGFAGLLHRYTGQEDITIGVPSGGRTQPEYENLVGFFVNNLVLRVSFVGDPSFRALVKQVNSNVLEAIAHEEVPFEMVVDEMNIDRDLSRSPLFQVLFAFQNYPTEEMRLPGLTVSECAIEKSAVAFDLGAYVHDTKDGIILKCQYNRDLFRKTRITRMLEQYFILLENASSNLDEKISRVQLLSESEYSQVTSGWNQTNRSFAGEACVHELFERAAVRWGKNVAASFPVAAFDEADEFTYEKLDRSSNQFAHYLRGQGVGRDVVVGICLDRTPELLVTLLGVLKAGGAYLPLDPAFPEQRLSYVVEDAGAKLVVTQNKLRSIFREDPAAVLTIEELLPIVQREPSTALSAGVEADWLAYLIYTSGSSGTPKGVEICHGSLSNFLLSMAEILTPGPGDRILAITTPSFDIAALELFLPLITGGATVVADSGSTIDGAKLQQLIKKYGITMMQATPSTWRLLLASGWDGNRSIKLLSGGEVLDSSLASELLKRCNTLWNVYGPTETTIWSTIFEVKNDSPVLIGRPIANTSLFVLDHNMQPVPVGVPGELCIGGRGVARGYRNRKQATSEQFVQSPFASTEIIYRTGDTVRWHEDGNVEYLGRTDNQVKLRGYRIELTEVETVLKTHPGVDEAVVLITGDDPADQRMVAYVAGSSTQCDSLALQDYLANRLPHYMVPSHVVRMPQLPRTPNGKIDRRSLSTFVTNYSGDKMADDRPPTDEVQQALTTIWAEVLGTDHVGRSDNFFRIGGHSLTTVRLASRINRQFSLNLPVVSFFEHPTIDEQCRLIKSSLAKPRPEEVVMKQNVTSPLSGKTPIDRHALNTPRGLGHLPVGEHPWHAVRNRILQLIARVAPNAVRCWVHRWRGVKIGQGVGIGYDAIIETSYPWLVSIANNSRIGMRTTIIGHFAEMEGGAERSDGPSVIIDEDVWIGPNVTILPNVHIEKGSVVAAGSVVNQNVPSRTLVQGNPAVPVARCPVPLTRETSYREFVQNLEPIG